MYIKQIQIKNFMTHKDTTLDLSEGINVITGKSTSGKSNIIRALIWLMYNNPSGHSFIRHGENEASVTIELDSGEIVTRGKNRKNKNYYELTNNDGKKVVFNNFGKDFPDEIKDVLGISEVRISDKSSPIFLNLCSQLESPFFVSDETMSADERARWISALMQIEDVDALVDSFSSDATSITRYELKSQESILKKRTEKLTEYVNLDEELTSLEVLKQLNKNMIDNQQKLDRLLSIQQQLVEYKKDVQSHRECKKSIKAILQHADIVDSVDSNHKQLSILQSISDNNTDISHQLLTIQTQKDTLLSQSNVDIAMIENDNNRYKTIITLTTQLQGFNQKVINNSGELKNNTENLKILIDQYVALLKSVGKCPTCFTDIKEDIVDGIEDGLYE